MGHDVTGRAGTNTTCHSTGSKEAVLSAAGASHVAYPWPGASPSGSAKEGSRLTVPRELETWAAGCLGSSAHRPYTAITNTVLTSWRWQAWGEAAAAAPRPLISPSHNPGPDRVPPNSGRTLLDRHRGKAGRGLHGEGAPMLFAQPQGTDSNLGGPRAQLSTGRGLSWSLSDSGWLWARSGFGLAGGSGCCTDMVLRRWFRLRRNSGCACRPKLPLRRIRRELFFLGRARWLASSTARCAA